MPCKAKLYSPLNLVKIKAQISQKFPILAGINKLFIVMIKTVEKGFISLDVERSLLLMNTVFASFVDCTNLTLSSFVIAVMSLRN